MVFQAVPMGACGKGGDDATALGRGKRLSLNGAQALLEEEESEASTSMARKSNKEATRTWSNYIWAHCLNRGSGQSGWYS